MLRGAVTQPWTTALFLLIHNSFISLNTTVATQLIARMEIKQCPIFHTPKHTFQSALATREKSAEMHW